MPDLPFNPEHVVTAWAEHAQGPGWSNRLIWVLTYNPVAGKLERHAIQPDEQSAEMLMLHKVCEAAHKSMTSAVKSWLYFKTPEGKKHAEELKS